MSQKYGTFVTHCGPSTMSPAQNHHLMMVDGFENPRDLGNYGVIRLLGEGLGGIWHFVVSLMEQWFQMKGKIKTCSQDQGTRDPLRDGPQAWGWFWLVSAWCLGFRPLGLVGLRMDSPPSGPTVGVWSNVYWDSGRRPAPTVAQSLIMETGFWAECHLSGEEGAEADEVSETVACFTT